VTYTAPRSIASGTIVTIVYSVCDGLGACSTGAIRITMTALGGLLPATGSQTALLLALAALFVGAGLVARRVGQGARVGRR
jgi:LPXTG-motif cell wall-anchored protein